MYDGRTNPGRNDECWCGSGKKYKKCHLAFDERLQSMYEQGFELPERASLKSAADIEGIKRSAAINIGVLDYVAERIGPGTTTQEVERWEHDYTVEHGGIPADLGYEGYPKSVCTSINDVVCHGIPSEDDVLREGDIVNVDCSTILDGYYSDSSRMFCIGAVSPERQRLVDETKKAMEAGLAAIEPWGLLGDVGAAVNAYAKAQGFSVVREFGGHGIGFDFHEDPFVSHVSEPGTGMVLVSVRNSCTPSDARALAAAAPDGVLSSDVRSAKREGDGIGLASVATLAKRYRGEVQVEIDEYAATIHVLLFAGDAR